MSRADYEALGGHMDHVVDIAEARRGMTGRQNDHVLAGRKRVGARGDVAWPTDQRPRGRR